MARFGKKILILACLLFICIVSYRNKDFFKIITHNPEEELRRLRYFLSNWRGHVLATLNMTRLTFFLKDLPTNVSMETWENWKIMNLPKIEFLPNYKNPCWMENYRPKITCRHVKRAGIDDVPENKRDVRVLRCLPYFFLIGQPKCGTTDIYARLEKHPDVELSKLKEFFWFERKRFESECSSLNSYLDFHLLNSRAVHNSTLPDSDYHQKIIGDACIKKQDLLDNPRTLSDVDNLPVTVRTTPEGSTFQLLYFVQLDKIVMFPATAVTTIASRQNCRFIDIGDGSVDVMWDNTIWPLLPGNQGCQEPCVTNPDMIHHLNPQARVIVSLRNPVDRVFSDFIYESQWLGYSMSKEYFHARVVRKIALFTDCLKTSTMRTCVYNGSLENSLESQIRLLQGLYSVHLSDWLRVFPRQQVHVVHFDSYTSDLEENMASIFKFLDLRQLDREEMERVTRVATKNTRKKSNLKLSMLNETRKLLNFFYKPFNKQLADILDDDRFLWDT